MLPALMDDVATAIIGTWHSRADNAGDQQRWDLLTGVTES
jgi:hypothetical protein